MQTLALQSEIFQPEGGAAAQGMTRALGQPKLDPISLLIRESVQNSWDARVHLGNKTKIKFSASLEGFTIEQFSFLKEIVFNQLPSNHNLGVNLNENLWRLTLEDRGTVGLTGPTFVERPVLREDRFLNFCRMFGRSWEGPVAGGTYGIGKSAYFGASAASTVIIYTRIKNGRNYTERLIGMSLGKANQHDLGTGRHWWGIKNNKEKVGPLEGSLACECAKRIGFRAFNNEETGTSIMILAPRIISSFESPEKAAQCISETMVIWFWPRILGGADSQGSLEFDVTCRGEKISLLDPKNAPPFNIYASAYDNLIRHYRHNQEVSLPNIVQRIRCENPIANLGWISLSLGLKSKREDMVVAKIDEHSFAEQIDQSQNIVPSIHHVALIRSPGQVIKYLKCRPHPDSSIEYAGVFLVDGDEDLEKAFAAAEPPSHDDWIHDQLEDPTYKKFVRLAIRHVKLAADTFATPTARPSLTTQNDPLGGLSASLGDLMSANGTGASWETKPKANGNPGQRNENGIKITGAGSLEIIESKPAFILPFKITIKDGNRITIAAHTRVVIAGGGAELEAPVGSDEPEVIGWRMPNGTITNTKNLRINQTEQGDWQVLVRLPSEAMIGVTLEIID